MRLLVLRMVVFSSALSWGLVLTTIAAGLVIERRFARTLWDLPLQKSVDVPAAGNTEGRSLAPREGSGHRFFASNDRPVGTGWGVILALLNGGRSDDSASLRAFSESTLPRTRKRSPSLPDTLSPAAKLSGPVSSGHSVTHLQSSQRTRLSDNSRGTRNGIPTTTHIPFQASGSVRVAERACRLARA